MKEVLKNTLKGMGVVISILLLFALFMVAITFIAKYVVLQVITALAIFLIFSYLVGIVFSDA